MTDMANYFNFRGKFDLKLLIFRLIITYLGTHSECAVLHRLNKKNSAPP